MANSKRATLVSIALITKPGHGVPYPYDGINLRVIFTGFVGANLVFSLFGLLAPHPSLPPRGGKEKGLSDQRKAA